jgi:PAS domain S-box-containing protein
VQRSRSIVASTWAGGVQLVVSTGIAYFLAGRLGLLLRAEPGIAVFWPASGIAVGALIALGPRARLSLAVSIFLAATACSVTIGRSLGLSIAFGLLGTGQALLTAWLLDRWFGQTFKLEDVQRALGFLAAITVGSGIAAAGAALAIIIVKPTASPLHVWQLWFMSSSLGAVTVAPLLIELGAATRERLSHHELIEGWGGILALTALSVLLISLPDGPWATALPEALVFPFLVWVAVRCPPVFAAGAALVVGLTIIGSTTLNIGNFDSGKPAAHRILSAQIFVFLEAILVVLLAAVFAERRRGEKALKQVAERLQLALDGAELGAFSADLTTGQLACDTRLAQFHAHTIPPRTIDESRCFVHAEDRSRIDDVVAEAQHTGRNWRAEYRVLPPPGHPHGGETRWVAVEGSIVRNPQGLPVQLLGVTRDITDRKRTEDALAERNAQLALAGKAALVGTYAYDLKNNMIRVTDGYAAIHGLPEGTTEIPLSLWQAGVHKEDLTQLERLRCQAYCEQRRDYTAEYRIIRDGEVRWIEARKFVSYDGNGRPRRVLGVNIDVTERKRAEEARNILNAELNHRVKNALATFSAVVSQTQKGSRSVASFAEALEGRIRSMANTHELLSARCWQGIPLAELVQRELAPYATRHNTEIDGPEVVLRAEAGQAMSMVLHELATNAAKYGALSSKRGRVLIRWHQRLNGHTPSGLVLEWREIGGPQVVATNKSGYGTFAIRELIPYEFGGTVDLRLAPEGARCRVELPADWLGSAGEPSSDPVPHALNWDRVVQGA